MTTEGDRLAEASPPARLLFSGAAVQTTGKLIALLLQLLSLVIVTRYLGRGGFADLAAGLAAAGIVEAVGEFGLTATLVMRFGEGHHPRAVLRTGLLASTAASVIGLALIAPVAFAVLSGAERLAFFFLLPASVVTLLTVSCLAYWQYELSFGRLARANVAAGVLSTAILAAGDLAARSWGTTPKLLLVGGSQALGAVVILVYLWPRHLPRADADTSSSQRRSVLAILMGALPLGVAGSISLLHVRADQLVLAGMHYHAGLATYAVAYRALEAIVSGIATISIVAFSLMSRTSGEERANRARTATVLLVGTGTLGALAFALLAPVIVPILGGSSFAAAVRSCRLLAPVVVMSVSNVMAGRVMIAARRATVLIGVALAGLALNVVLNLVLIPHLGTAGAATATVTTEGLGALAVAALASRQQPGSQPLGLIAGAISGVTASLLLWSWAGPEGRAAGLVIGIVTAAVVAAVATRSTMRDVRAAAAARG